MRKKISIMAALIIAVFFLSACGGTQLKVKQISMSENPTEQINRLDNDLRNARNNQINVLSPQWFAKAEKSFNDAVKDRNRGAALSDILKNVAESRAQLKRAEEFAKITSTSLSKVIKRRKLARASGATKMGKDYVKVEGQFLDLMRAVENNNLKSARKNEAKVISAFRQLELRAIKEQTLGEVRKLLKQAEKEDAKKFAPSTYALATNKLKATDAFISKNPYEKEKMLEKANNALFEAWRCVRVTRQSKKVKTMKPEQITLWYEKALSQTATALAAPDMRDEPFKIQVENILSSITALKQDRNFMIEKVKDQRAEINALKKQTASLEDKSRKKRAEIERLAAEKKFNKLFGKVRNLFNANEAEVYKQGSQLLIRLRAIQFPVGKYVIMPENYALLSKAQRAIRIFGEPNVVIEGHTDSTGSDELNEHLSEKRAYSVGQYLIANRTLPADKIVAVGYGSIRPLASNKTAKGRAVNRRIDIIIKPRSLSK
ncbi:MAG: OmpA family protein [Deltaproteobacteria bacterium]|nr:OmpA family protein [Deltaproteobacteria bacterium]